jgi:hypothetical protein
MQDARDGGVRGLGGGCIGMFFASLVSDGYEIDGDRARNSSFLWIFHFRYPRYRYR